MKLETIVKLLEATQHHIPSKNLEIHFGSASDLMSDVLAYMPGGNNIVLITGLLTQQVIRTAALMDITAVVFTRGKVPTEEIINAAKRQKIAVLSTTLTKYASCGKLYCAGLKSVDGYQTERM